MRILMLNYEFPPLGGGTGKANECILKEFADKDIKIDLITSSKNSSHKEAFSQQIDIYKLNVHKQEKNAWNQIEILIYIIKALIKAKRLDKKNNYDLIHVWTGFPCGSIALFFDAPYVVSLRGSDVPGYNSRFKLQYIFLKPLIKKVWKNADRIVANSKGLRDLASKTLDINIDIVPNGVNRNKFYTKTPNNSQKFTILTVSRLISRKRIKDLIKAVTYVEDVKLIVVGDGERKKYLENLSKKIQLEDRIVFKGHIDNKNLPSIYSKADLFVLPSYNEGMSNSVLEAMSAGIPIIMSKTGGSDELIKNNGEIVQAGKPFKIAEKINSYRRSPEKLEQHGKNSRRLAENFGWNKVANSYIEIYDSISR